MSAPVEEKIPARYVNEEHNQVTGKIADHLGVRPETVHPQIDQGPMSPELSNQGVINISEGEGVATEPTTKSVPLSSGQANVLQSVANIATTATSNASYELKTLQPQSDMDLARGFKGKKALELITERQRAKHPKADVRLVEKRAA